MYRNGARQKIRFHPVDSLPPPHHHHPSANLMWVWPAVEVLFQLSIGQSTSGWTGGNGRSWMRGVKSTRHFPRVCMGPIKTEAYRRRRSHHDFWTKTSARNRERKTETGSYGRHSSSLCCCLSWQQQQLSPDLLIKGHTSRSAGRSK